MSDKYRKAAEEMVAVVLPTIEGVLVKYMRAVLEETDSHLPRSATEADAREAFQAWAERQGHELMKRADCDEYAVDATVIAWESWIVALRQVGVVK